jgi:signal transduction histidine kinase/ActR/RegA family two-component response regulator
MTPNLYNNLQKQIRGSLPLRLQTVGDFHFFCFITCSIYFLLLLTPWMLLLDKPSVAWTTGVTAIVCLLLGASRIAGLKLTTSSQLYQATLLGVVLYGNWLLGGLNSPAMAWLGIVPLLPWFTLSRLWTYVWLGLAFSSVWIFWVFHYLGWLPMQTGVGFNDLLFNASMYSTLCVAQGILLLTLDTADADNLQLIELAIQELGEVNTKLMVANRHKDQFLAMVSHAMRTPLNGVKGFLSLLSDRSELSPEAQAEVTGALNAASHLLTVINDLLDLSQISQGRFSLNPQVIQLQDSVRDTHRALESLAHQMGLDYRLDIAPDVPTWVKVDPDRLAQILINLLGNAIKFTPKGQVLLKVSAQHINEVQAILKFDVIDNGIGIRNDQLDRVFEPFFQSNHMVLRVQDEGLKGNGLGLAISKGLAQAMGGELMVSSTLGEGSCFNLVVPLPLASPALGQAQPREQPPEVSDEYPYRLLIVDDQAVNRTVMAATLKKMLPNAELTLADGGVSALGFLHKQVFDLVLIDLIMPDMDGIEVVRRARLHLYNQKREVPFIAITANVAPDAVADCMAVGVVQVMPKPFNRQGLLRAIQTHSRRDQVQ